MIERIHRIISEASDHEVIISVNSHTEAEILNQTESSTARGLATIKKGRLALKQLKMEFGERVYAYSDEDIMELFPDLSKSMKKFHVGRIGMASYAYYLHDEAILTTLKQYQQKKGVYKGCGLWVIEDDLEYTGNWGDLFQMYSGRADLVTTYWRDSYPLKEQFWAPYTSQRFRQRFVRNGLMVKHNEHIVYYSRKFLHRLFVELRNGAHAQSEMGTPSICSALGFTYAEIEEVSEKYYSCKQRYTRDTYSKYITDEKQAGGRFLVHPVKY
ncbi:hypothetical protein AAMO2058_000264600 [Amorphochlora amoebiformis]